MSGVCFYALLRLPTRWRWIALVLLELLVFLSPLIVPERTKFPRLMASLAAILVGVKLYDLHRTAQAGLRPGPWQFVTYLPNALNLVWRRVLAEPRPPWRNDLIQCLAGLTAGAASVLLLIQVFRIDWRMYPAALEHVTKIVGLFLVIRTLPNGLAAGCRLLAIPATDAMGSFFSARTPAEFWRRYNRPAEQFFYEYVFKPSGGVRHPVRATLITFAFSGIVHEYVFDIAAGYRAIGWQMAFFLIQGVASVATLRLRPTGWRAAACIVLTLAFNLATARIFFESMNRVLPFYVSR